jgi:AcrR family transcriptional regulator
VRLDQGIIGPLPASQGLRDLPATARRILEAAKTIVAERGFAELTMTTLEQESSANRALVAYYFKDKAGLIAAIVDSLFSDPDAEIVEEIRDLEGGPARTERFLEWQRRVSMNDRVNRTLYELVPHALKDPDIRRRFAEEYRLYRSVDAECLRPEPAELDDEEAEALAAVTIAVVEGLAIQRALDPDGFDHARAWRCWRDVIGCYLHLPARRDNEEQIALIAPPPGGPAKEEPMAP